MSCSALLCRGASALPTALLLAELRARSYISLIPNSFSSSSQSISPTLILLGHRGCGVGSVTLEAFSVILTPHKPLGSLISASLSGKLVLELLMEPIKYLL